ncbi:MAG: response regulator [Kiritimatiellaeota bacterium]|nr:response regulator [Kiritimatiellota bacterium]
MKQFADDGRRTGWVVLLIFVVFAGGLVAAGYNSYRNYARRYRGEVERQLSAVAELKVSELTQLPRRNGWETLTALRALRADLPVILASGYDEASVMAGEHPERPQAFLSKPYTLKELREALGHALGVS